MEVVGGPWKLKEVHGSHRMAMEVARKLSSIKWHSGEGTITSCFEFRTVEGVAANYMPCILYTCVYSLLTLTGGQNWACRSQLYLVGVYSPPINLFGN